MTMLLLPVLEVAARLVGQPLPRDRMDTIKQLLASQENLSGPAVHLLQKLWKIGGLDGIPQPLPNPLPMHCPFIARHPDLGWLVILSPVANHIWTAQNGEGHSLRVDSLDHCECMTLPVKTTDKQAKITASKLVKQAIWRHKFLYLEAILATFMINLLTLATSLYSMQVYDRVIPNQSMSTLFVLSAGVGVAVLLELLLKHVRGVMLENSATRIDMELSDWFYNRALCIRLEAHPPAVGTLASQIKGFELIRNVMNATTLYVLADIPFAIVFILVIAMIGGMTASVPLLMLPFALISGLMFRQRINKYTLESQGQHNQKAGLLVESIDSIECLKANSAEWNMQGRWNRLVGEAGLCDLRIRNYSAISQHVTALFQQIGYVLLIATGAYLVTQNTMTMGALIACAIISNRALMPVAQLPAIIVQLGNAKAAATSLDALIDLPNEMDERAHTLTPERLEGSLYMERTRFNYGRSNQPALEVGRLEIRPGERVGLIGAVGSGKSTLLKMASGLYRPNEGRILLGGVEMALISPQVLRRHIAYLPQEIRLISGTLRDNILMGLPDPGDDALLHAAHRTGLIDLITRHPRGMALPITEGGRGISGGQRQLIGLTRAILASPSLYIMDEPTSSMDSTSEIRIVKLLHELTTNGATLMVATHKTALLPILDHLLVLQNGMVAIDGPRDLVLARLAGQSMPPSPPIA